MQVQHDRPLDPSREQLGRSRQRKIMDVEDIEPSRPLQLAQRQEPSEVEEAEHQAEALESSVQEARKPRVWREAHDLHPAANLVPPPIRGVVTHDDDAMAVVDQASSLGREAQISIIVVRVQQHADVHGTTAFRRARMPESRLRSPRCVARRENGPVGRIDLSIARSPAERERGVLTMALAHVARMLVENYGVAPVSGHNVSAGSGRGQTTDRFVLRDRQTMIEDERFPTDTSTRAAALP